MRNGTGALAEFQPNSRPTESFRPAKTRADPESASLHTKFVFKLRMTRLSKFRKAELDLGRRSNQLAEEQSQHVAPGRLDETITEFIEWRAFSYWLRLIVETQGFLSDAMIAILRKRSPGFLEHAAAYARLHPREPEFLWLRFLEWADEKVFQLPTAEGWRHALGYYATRDPRMDQIRKYWKQCRLAWKLRPPAPLPNFESWRESALQCR